MFSFVVHNTKQGHRSSRNLIETSFRQYTLDIINRTCHNMSYSCHIIYIIIFFNLATFCRIYLMTSFSQCHFYIFWYFLIFSSETAEDIYPYATFHLPMKDNLGENIGGFFAAATGQSPRLSNAEVIPIRQVSDVFLFLRMTFPEYHAMFQS